MAELFDEDPSRSDRIVDDYVGVVRRATAWERSPTIYEPSVSYFKAHFATLDPDRHHRFPDVRRLRPVSLGELAVAPPVFAGTPVVVSGPLYGTPSVVATTGAPGALSWAFSIRDPEIKGALVLARVPFRGDHRLDRGDRVSISGLVIAEGAARFQGRGLTRVSYLAGSSIAPSTRLVLVPQSRRPRSP